VRAAAAARGEGHAAARRERARRERVHGALPRGSPPSAPKTAPSARKPRAADGQLLFVDP
jgi:hypothetical protein